MGDKEFFRIRDKMRKAGVSGAAIVSFQHNYEHWRGARRGLIQSPNSACGGFAAFREVAKVISRVISFCPNCLIS